MPKQHLRRLIAGGLLCAAGLFALPAAQAALVSDRFVVDIDSGPLDGFGIDPFFGSVSFNDAGGYDPVFGTIDLGFFGFVFVDGAGNPTVYGLGDADTTPTAQEDVFASGTFVGINYVFTGANLSFTFAPGSFALSEATFSYEYQGQPGTGLLTIPLPTTSALILVGAAGWLVASRRRRAIGFGVRS